MPRRPALLLLAIAVAAATATACTEEHNAPPGAPAPAPAVPDATAADAEPAPVEDGTGRSIRHWQCAETGVASARDDAGRMRLFLSGRTLVLAQDGSGAIARWSEAVDGGTRFEVADGSARLALDGAAFVDCAPSARPSPWFDAAYRGVALRGVGNEPGWFVEVSGGQAPSLHAELDYGDTVLDLAPVSAGALDGPPWTARTPDGREVRVDARRGRCVDGMSGERFEASVDLRVGDRTWSGCGASLEGFAHFPQH